MCTCKTHVVIHSGLTEADILRTLEFDEELAAKVVTAVMKGIYFDSNSPFVDKPDSYLASIAKDAVPNILSIVGFGDETRLFTHGKGPDLSFYLARVMIENPDIARVIKIAVLSAITFNESNK